MSALLQEINWVDIFFAVIFLWIIYKGSRLGVAGQVIPILGLIITLVVSVSYYVAVSDSVLKKMLGDWGEAAAFFVIFLAVTVPFKLVGGLLGGKEEGESSSSSVEKLAGAVLGAGRAFLFFGLIGIFFLLVPVDSVRSAAGETSKSCMFFVDMDVKLYNAITKYINIIDETKKEEGMDGFLSHAGKGTEQ